jgi:STAS-like domain of unknown function (DUF4325)
MVAIRISDHVTHASTYADGEVIFNLLKPAVLAGEVVEVSFAGIQAVPSAFVNAAFLRLLEIAPIERVRASLRFTDSTKFINELIRNRFEFVSHSAS